ncbi:MAG: antibiotic biosynthesis monooxygenase [Desulfobacterales bacterium]|nr:antibiotic biosynthesis monooxygenase [Desulfobacterales bacterium]
MLAESRKAAMDQPGYLMGETLLNHYDSRSILVVSTWQNVDDWIRWQNSPERDRNEARIEELLDRPTVYEIFDVRASSG